MELNTYKTHEQQVANGLQELPVQFSSCCECSFSVEVSQLSLQHDSAVIFSKVNSFIVGMATKTKTNIQIIELNIFIAIQRYNFYDIEKHFL
jgi:hypothetical protein